MWPDLMGPGWQWHVLATVALLAALLASIGLVARAALREEPACPDPLLVLWHRYEVGDLTRREFERQRGTLARRMPAPPILWTQSPAAEARGAVIYEPSSAERTSPGSA